MSIDRRQFVRVVPALGMFQISGVGSSGQSQGTVPSELLQWPGPAAAAGAPVDESFPTQHASLAKEMVGVSHGNLARVKELVSRHPSLAKASWDWGFGDWETALGAASHTGQRSIAEFLIDNGAPQTVYSAAMLGQLELVKAFAAVTADISQLRGPHGIPLLNHARAGGAAAAAVLSWLEAFGPGTLDAQPLDPADRASLEGRYAFGNRARDAFLVDSQQGLGITRIGASKRFLTHVGSLTFYPSGAPAVRIRFERDSRGRVSSLTVHDPDIVVRATR